MTKVEQDVAVQYADHGSVSRSNILRYSITMQILTGNIKGSSFGPVRCNSGGGQTGFEKSVSLAKINPHQKKNDAHRGGAIPPGWWIALPEILSKGQRHGSFAAGGAPTNNSIRLVPYQLASGYGESKRDSFYIHGNGGHGSDGCLIMGPAPRTQLVTLISAAGGAWLQVYWDQDELQKQSTLSATA